MFDCKQKDVVMKRDIESRADLERLLESFYSVAMSDEKIGHFFSEVVRLDLTKHLPVIVDFWEKVLFGKPVYQGNPLAVHQQLHEKSPILKEHFERWVEIFIGTIDKLFAGDLAETAKTRANTIAGSLYRRLNNEESISIVPIAR